MTQLWPLSGGIHPPQHKQPTESLPIGRLPLAERFYISLLQDRGEPEAEVLRPLVAQGEQVLKGQMIATGPGAAAVPVHAPTSGTIGALVQRPLNHPSGNLGPHLELISDGQDQWCPLTPHIEPFALEKTAALRLIQQAGICGMGGAGFPTALKLASELPIHTLILNGTECEPYITADDRLMQEEPADIVQGALLCAHILGANRLKIAIEDNKPTAISAMGTALKSIAGIHPAVSAELAVLPTIYPSGGTKQLVQILTGQQVPSGQQAASLGLLVLNVATARAVWRALRLGEPLIERVTTFAGKALQAPQNLWVPLGTPAEYLLGQLGWQTASASANPSTNPSTNPNPNTTKKPDAIPAAPLILGGPLMGYGLNSAASLGKTSNCVIAPSADEMPGAGQEAPCIRCGQCDNVCPAQLLPQQLFWYAKAQDVPRLLTHNLFDCIECGACSYVCPSTIPLVQYYRQAKADIRSQQATKRKADQARSRFEARLARLSEQEAEKDRKRTARQTASDAINAQLAEGPAAPIIAPQAPSSEELAAKLKRHQQSAQERLAGLQQQAAQEQDTARQERLAASIKQAQLRLAEADAKLQELHELHVLDKPAAKAIEKLTASPQQLANQAMETLQKQLAITEAKLATAKSENLPSLNALTLAVEKLHLKIQQAQAEQSANAQPLSNQPTLVDPATLAAAEQALARLAAKKTLSPQAKQQALKESLEKRIAQLHQRIANGQGEQIAVLKESLATLEARLDEINQSDSD